MYTNFTQPLFVLSTPVFSDTLPSDLTGSL